MSTRTVTSETRLVGLPISGGIAVGRVCRFNEQRHSSLATYRVSGDSVAREKERVSRAIELAAKELDTIIQNVATRLGAAEAKIFEAQKAIVGDPVLVDRIFQDLEDTLFNAETAVSRVLDDYEAQLLDLDDDYLKERATDIGEIRRRLLDMLADTALALQCADETRCQRGRGRVVVTAELTAGMTVAMDVGDIKAFVTERGGPTAHAAILARALGIPAVSGLKAIHSKLTCGTKLLVNGNTGEVIVWPNEEKIAQAAVAPGAIIGGTEAVEPVSQLTVMANISRSTEVHAAMTQQAEGVGLYRTEFEFFAAKRLLEEDEQYQRYAHVVQAMEGKRVCFRLLDIGGDKQGPPFNLPEEKNPYLGLRGSRLLLDQSELFQPQARALARVSMLGPVDVLYPMVVDVEQFLKLRTLFQEAVGDLETGDLRHGVMFEVPSACLSARELLEVSDFGSIGTNDLIQYLFAVDRNNELVAHDYTPDKPAFWTILEQIAVAARATGKTVSICGEVANNLQLLPKMMQLGLKTFSVSPRFIPNLRLTAK